MIFIADCGGTKVHWCLIDEGNTVCEFCTPGMNALMLSHEAMVKRLHDEVNPQIKPWADKISHIYFYGAGCASPDICGSVADALRQSFPTSKIEVYTDMLGTCRALCGDLPGLVCILGTGANSCFYDGQKIVENVPPLGYILGDEGSGAYLGKILVGDIFKKQLPEEICRKFQDKYHLSAIDVVQKVYREPYPNKFLASLTNFIYENITNLSIRTLVVNAFKAFFLRNVCLYPSNPLLGNTVHFCGSLAFGFKDQLAEAAAWYGFKLGSVHTSPMEGLIKYHSK